MILFPSPLGNLNITTLNGGNFESYQDPHDLTTQNTFTLSMSDSAVRQWSPNGEVSIFGLNDHAATPPELNNPNPVEINIAGSVNYVTVRTTKATQMTVGGDMLNSSVLGENLHSTDVTSVNVAGKISYSPAYTFTTLSGGISGADPVNPSAWDGIFSVMVNPNVSLQVPANVLLMTPAQQTAWAYANLRLVLRSGYQLQPGYDPNANPGFVYDPVTKQLGFQYQMPQSVLSALNSTAIPILQLDPLGHVIIQEDANGNYHFATKTTSFIAPASLEALYTQSLNSVKDAQSEPPGFQIGGPGQFSIKAASMDLGSSGGIISWGVGSAYNPVNYAFLAPWTTSGASVNVNVAGDITMLSSTIASIYGGNVSVNCGSALSLSQGNFALIPAGANVSTAFSPRATAA